MVNTYITDTLLNVNSYTFVKKQNLHNANNEVYPEGRSNQGIQRM